MLVFSGSFFWHQNFPPTKSEKKGFSDIDSPRCGVIPQIAIAIGVLTSNRGEGRRTTLADWTWHQGAIAGCSGRGAIAGCHCRVPLQCAMVGGGGWRPTLGGVDVVPLQGAIVVCYGWVPVWRPTLGEWTWCMGTLHSNGIQKKKHPEKLPWAYCRRYTVLYIDKTKIEKWFLLSGVYAGIIWCVFSRTTWAIGISFSTSGARAGYCGDEILLKRSCGDCFSHH